MSASLAHCLRAALSCLAVAAPVSALAGPAETKQSSEARIIRIDVAPQSVTGALIDFSQQANVQVLMPTATVSHLKSGGASGSMALEEALQKLLGGTPLTYRMVDDSTVTIFAREQSGALDGTGMGDRTGAGTAVAMAAGPESAPAVPPFQADMRQEEYVGPDGTVQQLDVIMVTAQKRTQSLQEVPVAVSAIRAETLTAQNLVQLRDFYTRIPGLTYRGGGGHTMLALRGVVATSAGNPAVGTTIDDVPFGPSSVLAFGSRLSANLDPAYLDHIEVLRGPQGTLYGASSLGGLLKYVTKTPDPGVWSGSAELSKNSVSSGGEGWSARGALNIPIVDDRVGASVSGFYREDPGYIDYVAAGVDDANTARVFGGRVALYIKPVDAVTINLAALHQNLSGWGSPDIDADANYQPIYGELALGSTTTLATYALEKTLYSARVEADLGSVELVSVTGVGTLYSDSFNDRTIRDQPNLIRFGYPDAKSTLLTQMETDKVSQEVRLASTGQGALSWMLGGFYTKEKSAGRQALDIRDPSSNAVLATMLLATFPSEFEESAGFVNLGYQVTEKFDIQVGGRYSRNDQRYSEVVSGLMYPVEDRINSRSSDGSFTWLLTPKYQFTEDVMAYVRVATGYRPGGPNTPVPGIPTEYNPDTTINYEFGLKGSALDRMMTYAVSVYRIDWDDIQVGLVDPATQFSYFGNGNEARSEGIELELTYRPWMGMMLTGQASYNDARLVAALSDQTANLVGLKGDRLPYSARLSGSLSADQSFDIGGQWTATIGATATYLGDRVGEFPSIAGIERAAMKAYASYDLRGSLEYQNFVIGLYVRNLTDKRAYTQAGLRTPTLPANGYGLSVVQPRMVGMSLGFRF